MVKEKKKDGFIVAGVEKKEKRVGRGEGRK